MGLRQADYERLISRLESSDASPEEVIEIRKEAAICLRDAAQRITELEGEIAELRRAVKTAAIDTYQARDA
jgi:hypothetical protein